MQSINFRNVRFKTLKPWFLHFFPHLFNRNVHLNWLGQILLLTPPCGVLEQCAMLQCKRLTRLKTAWSRPHGAVWPRLTAASQYNICIIFTRAQNTYLQIMNNIEAQKNCGPDQNRFWKLDHRSAICWNYLGLSQWSFNPL